MREGKRFRAAHLELRASATPFVHNDGERLLRVGIIVPRFAHSAVLRNRVKRRLRELVRIHVLPHADVAAQMVLRARAAAYAASYGVLREELNALMDQFVNSSRTTAR